MGFPRGRRRAGILIGAFGLSAALFAANAIAEPSAAADAEDADALRAAALSTGAVVVTRDGESVEQYGSGTTRFGTDDAPDGDDQFRVGSNTKMFVSTVLLQLVEEGLLDLDAPIGEYLPGLVTGEGIDESRITVRQLMQHTSGLADNLTVDVLVDPTLQLNAPTPEHMASLGLRHGSQSEPGAEFLYSNTGYTVLGLLIEELTGQRVGEAIDERIVAPLGLDETWYAYAGDKEIPDAHFSGYLGAPPLVFDVTGYEPGVWAAAGALLSSGADLTEFLDALLGGELLSEAMLDELRTTHGDSGYGLGIVKAELTCGTAWGHSGHVIGYLSFAFADGAGRSVFAAVNASPTDLTDPAEEVGRVVDAALCGSDGESPAQFSDGVTAELEHAEEAAAATYDDRAGAKN
ncbi:MAG: serine hydrolase domain-containing protein [Stackebrandtia sp.]